MKLRLGTRGSELALTQSRQVAQQICEAFQQQKGEILEIEEVILETRGDVDQSSALHSHSAPGVFTKELERALLAGEVDFAVHSLKDLPTQTPEGLQIAAIPSREEPWDAWLSTTAPDLVDLAPGSQVATGSLRRRAQILHEFPELEVVGIRGNIDTRIAKVEERGDAGLILAAAGLRRTGREALIRSTFSVSEMTPAPGQGALALEVRAEDHASAEILALVDDPETRREVTAERAFLAALEGGCHLPIGAFARTSSGADRSSCTMVLVGMVATPEGDQLLRLGTEGDGSDPIALGEQFAASMLKSGGQEILEELMRRSDLTRESDS